jgi:hypothetical protein
VAFEPSVFASEITQGQRLFGTSDRKLLYSVWSIFFAVCVLDPSTNPKGVWIDPLAEMSTEGVVTALHALGITGLEFERYSMSEQLYPGSTPIGQRVREQAGSLKSEAVGQFLATKDPSIGEQYLDSMFRDRAKAQISSGVVGVIGVPAIVLLPGLLYYWLIGPTRLCLNYHMRFVRYYAIYYACLAAAFYLVRLPLDAPSGLRANLLSVIELVVGVTIVVQFIHLGSAIHAKSYLRSTTCCALAALAGVAVLFGALIAVSLLLETPALQPVLTQFG